MSGPGHPVRRVQCPTCLARRYNRCQTARGVPVSWHHAARVALAATPAIGAPRRTIPAEALQLLAAGVSQREVTRRTGVSRTRLYRHEAIVPKVRRPGVGGRSRELPPEVHTWHAEGVPIREIARRSGISRTVLRRHGIVPRPEEHPQSGPPPAEEGAPTAPTT